MRRYFYLFLIPVLAMAAIGCGTTPSKPGDAESNSGYGTSSGGLMGGMMGGSSGGGFSSTGRTPSGNSNNSGSGTGGGEECPPDPK